MKNIIWTIFGVISSCAAAIYGLPTFLGIFNIVFTEGNKPEPEASFGLAILAATLGGFILLFSSNHGESVFIEGSIEKWRSYSIKYLGRLLLFSAFCFTFIAFLSPFFPTAKDNLAPLEIAVKYGTVICFFLGGACLSVSVIIGMFQVFLW
ncbi:MAG: hypothetical protein WC566_06405 [Dehalococcoidia bacterium]